jgi:hypothetical protein
MVHPHLENALASTILAALLLQRKQMGENLMRLPAHPSSSAVLVSLRRKRASEYPSLRYMLSGEGYFLPDLASLIYRKALRKPPKFTKQKSPLGTQSFPEGCIRPES